MRKFTTFITAELSFVFFIKGKRESAAFIDKYSLTNSKCNSIIVYKHSTK